MRARYVEVSRFSGSTSKWRNRQTRQLEGLVLERGWGFKSPLRHQFCAVFPQVRDLRGLWITRPAGHLSAICQQSTCVHRRSLGMVRGQSDCQLVCIRARRAGCASPDRRTDRRRWPCHEPPQHIGVASLVMIRPADLPVYDDPPADEVALAVYFDEIEGYSDAIPVKMMQLLSSDGYSDIAFHPRLDRDFGDPTKPVEIAIRPSIVFASQAKTSRVWLTTADEQFVLQFQNTVLILNWRGRGKQTYPGFEQLLEQYAERYTVFESVLGELGLSKPTVNLVEVVYVNWVPKTIPLTSFFLPASKHYLTAPTVDPVPEAVSWRSENRIVDASGRHAGRLSVDCQSAKRVKGGGFDEGAQFTLIARQVPKDPTSFESAKECLSSGSHAIVRSFADLTTREAQDAWRIRRGETTPL